MPARMSRFPAEPPSFVAMCYLPFWRGVGGWPVLGACDWRLFSGGVLSLYRQLLGLRASGRWNYTSAQLLDMTGLPSPQTLLHLERLRFLGQLVRHGPDELWALVGNYSQYKKGLCEASVWFLAALGNTCELGPIDSDVNHWALLLLESPGRWKGLLKRAEAWYSESHRIQATFDAVVRTAWRSAQPISTELTARLEHGCLPCGLAFASRQQWGAHAQKVHGYRNAATQHAIGRNCRACGSRSANRSRLRCHLLACARCLQFLEAAGKATPESGEDGHVQAPVVRGWGDFKPPGS